MENPIEKFNSWWKEALSNSPLDQKSAVCISTIDEKGFPTGRFVDLKQVDERGFIFCTAFDSAKGKQIKRNPNTAITIWWDHVGYQVRVVGLAEVIEQTEASAFWETRNRGAKLTTTAFQQSQPLHTEIELAERLDKATEQFTGQQIPKPENWGGYCVKPLSIEFLTFQKSRLHLREFFEKRNGVWMKRFLQP